MTEDMAEARLLEEIDDKRDELLQLCSELITTPSENPPGDCTRVAGVIEDYLTKNGVEADLIDAGDGRRHVLSHRPNGDNARRAKEKRHLILNGHTDVVPVGDGSRWSFPPFAGDVKDGYLRGRGASDMKAGLAGMVFAYTLAHRLDLPLSGDLSLAAVPDEETGGARGADWLLRQERLEDVTSAVIAEPAERRHPTIGQKGSNWFRLTVTGRPGHGSLQPLHGLSANLEAARAIVALQDLWELQSSPPEDALDLISRSKRFAEEREGYVSGIGEVFEHVTINVGTIRGGTSTNVVADNCVVEFDTRVPIGLSRREVLDRARVLLADAGVDASIEAIGFQSEPNWTPPEAPIVTELVQILSELLDFQSVAGVLQWASSDARAFRSRGIPTLQYGPAELSTVHGIDERAPVEDIILATKVYALTIARHLGLTPT